MALGLDVSLRGAGLVVVKRDKVLAHARLETEPVKDGQTSGLRERRNGTKVFRGTDEERINWIAKRVASAVRKFGPHVCVMEGHSFASKGRGVSILHECVGVIKNRLYRLEVPVTIIAPPTLKKFATGNGRAEKVEMVAAALRRWPACPDDDQADAFFLAQMAFRTDL